MIIGVSGGSGSGKSTLSRFLESQGFLFLDCDQIYHELLEIDPGLLRAIEDRFPGTTAGGVLDRKKLGDIVFADQQALLDLNAITHAAVRQEVLRRLKNWDGHAVIDAIGLHEGGLSQLCHHTVAVIAPVEDRVARLVQREGITPAYARSRIAAQKSDDWFREKCQYILVNDGTYQDFTAKCVAFLRQIGIMEP